MRLTFALRSAGLQLAQEVFAFPRFPLPELLQPRRRLALDSCSARGAEGVVRYATIHKERREGESARSKNSPRILITFRPHELPLLAPPPSGCGQPLPLRAG